MLLILALIGLATCAALDLEYGVPTNCSLLVDEPLVNNTAAIERLRAACAADATCASLYGQANGPQLTRFAIILNQAEPLAMPYTIQSAVRDAACGATLEEIEDKLWVLYMTIAAQSFTACAPGETYVPKSDGSGGRCVASADSTINGCLGEYGAVVGIVIGLAVLAIIGTIHSAWTYTKKWRRPKKND